MRRLGRLRTPVAWQEVVDQYRCGGCLPDEALEPLLHREDLPDELQPLLLEAHPKLRTLPVSVNRPYAVAPPRWLLKEALPHWDQVGHRRRESLVNVVQKRLLEAEELIGRLAPAGYAAEVLESSQHVHTVGDLVPHCRDLLNARVPDADAAAWAAATRLLADFSGTLVELLTAAQAATMTVGETQHHAGPLG